MADYAVPTQGGNNNSWGTDLNNHLANHAKASTGFLYNILQSSTDTDTILDLGSTTPDKVTVTVGGEVLLTLEETTQDIVTIGDGGDVDFKVLVDSSLIGFFVQGSDGFAGFGTTSPSTQVEILGAVATAGTVTLSTAELTVVDGDELGRINFQAPLESSGTDAILVAASIWAEANDTFAADNNTTDLVFATGASETATEKVRILSDGGVVIGSLKSGATQVAAGAAANELWVTSGHATQEDNTVMIGT